MSEQITVPITMDITWQYGSVNAIDRFSQSLKSKRIEALQCQACGRRYLPPRPFCGNCRIRIGVWVPVQDVGTIKAWTVVYQPILDGRTGQMRPSPYGMAMVLLDGADTALNHFLAANDPSRLRRGLRVKAVWRDELHGSIDDIEHFEVSP